MENPLVNELITGKDLANQLKNHLDTATSIQECELLVESILSCYENALSMLNLVGNNLGSESPNSLLGTSSTPSSDNSGGPNHPFKKNVSRKRKTKAKWSDEVRACTETVVDGALGSDGYSWRKYGQKDILGAKFPRAYYRCTHRHLQGCLATKQVQISDADPSVYQIMYRGRHTCSNSSHAFTPLATDVQTQSKRPKIEAIQEEVLMQNVQFDYETCLISPEECLNYNDEIFPTFCLSNPPTPAEPENPDGLFSMAPPLVSGNDGFGGADSLSFIFPELNIQTSGSSDFGDYISGPTSDTSSPMADWDFSLDNFELPTDFQFDLIEPEFFD